MKCLHARNVNFAFDMGMDYLREWGHSADSRNGRVIVAPGPVTTSYARPRERVLWSPTRDCNPFLHLFESLWMIAGREDVDFLSMFTKNFQQFSDDGQTLNGAYGFRWRHGAEGKGPDQIEAIIALISKDPTTRRAVITMWERNDLFNQSSKDIPCNLSIAFSVRRKVLDMTVFNRSNDMIWGAYGANAVHMSFLHEYVAVRTGLKVGIYHQVSNNFHVYTDLPVWERLQSGALPAANFDKYVTDQAKTSPMLVNYSEDPHDFETDLDIFFELFDRGRLSEAVLGSFRTAFFMKVVNPMLRLWYQPDAVDDSDLDWVVASKEWLTRRGRRTPLVVAAQ